MQKLDYYQRALESFNISKVPTKAALDLLESLYSKQYTPTKSFDEQIINELIDLNLVETSTDMSTISPLGQGLIETAAKIYGTENIVSKHTGSVKRKVTQEMYDLSELAQELIRGKIDVKLVEEDRSNILVHFKKAFHGIPGLEIKNKPEFRILVRKASKEVTEYFEKIGMTYRETPRQTYFDIERSEENLKKLINAVLELPNLEH